MLEKKDVVQKSFRIDKKLDIALSELADILNRSQNELVDYAIRLLIKENGKWFADAFVDEYYHKIFHDFYKPLVEKINEYELIFEPYDYTSKEGAFIYLKKYYDNNKCVEVYKHKVGNDPGSMAEISNALGEIAMILANEYPELKKRYNITTIDV